LDAPAACFDLVRAKLVRNLSHAEWKQYTRDIPHEKQYPRLPVQQDSTLPLHLAMLTVQRPRFTTDRTPFF
jgi:hypothetical protein